MRTIGHSTRPATSSSRPGSSATVTPRAAAALATSSAIVCRRSAASVRTLWPRSLACQSAQEETAKAPGARKRWPSVKSAEANPWPSSAPSARENGTTAPSSRQVIRRSGRTQVNWLVPPQRIDFGQGKRRSKAGSAAAIRSAAEIAALAFSSTQKSPSWRSWSFVAPCLRRKPASACSGALARGPRSVLELAAIWAATSSARAMRRGP